MVYFFHCVDTFAYNAKQEWLRPRRVVSLHGSRWWPQMLIVIRFLVTAHVQCQFCLWMSLMKLWKWLILLSLTRVFTFLVFFVTKWKVCIKHSSAYRNTMVSLRKCTCFEVIWLSHFLKNETSFSFEIKANYGRSEEVLGR